MRDINNNGKRIIKEQKYEREEGKDRKEEKKERSWTVLTSLHFFMTNEWGQKARQFDTGKPLQSRIMFHSNLLGLFESYWI